jgi:predicted Holliday junction resolvase-like endonuclease
MLLLDSIPIDSTLLLFIVGIILIIIIYALRQLIKAKEENADFKLKYANQELAFERVNNDLKVNVNALAQAQFEKFKAVELDSYKRIADQSALDASKVLLQRWVIENEERIRKDAANRSVRIVMGKVTEHLIPFSEAFNQFNPKDARFIGSPIDLIVFDGAEDKRDEITIWFVEIKTGTSALSTRQKKIMEAVKQKRVEWIRLNVKDFGDEVGESLLV